MLVGGDFPCLKSARRKILVVSGRFGVSGRFVVLFRVGSVVVVVDLKAFDVVILQSFAGATNGTAEGNELFLQDGVVIEDGAIFKAVTIGRWLSMDYFADEAWQVDGGWVGFDRID